MIEFTKKGIIHRFNSRSLFLDWLFQPKNAVNDVTWKEDMRYLMAECADRRWEATAIKEGDVLLAMVVEGERKVITFYSDLECTGCGATRSRCEGHAPPAIACCPDCRHTHPRQPTNNNEAM